MTAFQKYRLKDVEALRLPPKGQPFPNDLQRFIEYIRQSGPFDIKYKPDSGKLVVKGAYGRVNVAEPGQWIVYIPPEVRFYNDRDFRGEYEPVS